MSTSETRKANESPNENTSIGCSNNRTDPNVLDVAAKHERTELPDGGVDTAIDRSNLDITYVNFKEETQLYALKELLDKELSEPYSIYTYRYFIYNWPHLCFMAKHGDSFVGVIVCKLEEYWGGNRGYIAMLAVESVYRKLKIGTTLTEKAVEAMIAEDAVEVVLEAELTNKPALRLYESLGFIRTTRLLRYYMNGADALRLKLPLK